MPTCTLKDTSIEATGDYQDTVTHVYQADLDAVIENPLTALAMSQSAGPKPVPPRRANLAGTALYAQQISGKRASNRKWWDWTVQFTRLPPGEDETQQNPNPLLRPPVYNVDYQEQEYVVKQARNQTALTGGFTRPIGTLGPIVNAAFRRPDEPIVRTRRIGVITIEKNLANLGDVMDRNEDFQDTTNSDSIVIGSKTFDARRLKFEVCRSLGRQEEGGVIFIPSVTEIAIYKSTDLTLDNVGYEYWDAATSKYVRAKDGEGNDTAEPVNLNLDGTLKATGVIGDTGAVSITYRDLEPVPYSGFFS
jgi:hypothetical protein